MVDDASVSAIQDGGLVGVCTVSGLHDAVDVFQMLGTITCKEKNIFI